MRIGRRIAALPRVERLELQRRARPAGAPARVRVRGRADAPVGLCLPAMSLSHPRKHAGPRLWAAMAFAILGVAFTSSDAWGECRIDDAKAYLPNVTVSTSG